MPTPDVPRVRSDLNYDAVAPSFRWEHLYSELDWLPGGWLNMAHEAIDRHATGSRADKTALVWQGTHGEREDYNFGQMKEQSDRFANVLRSLGVEKGDRVFILLQRIPELYFAFFGVLKTGAIVSPMFSALGPEQVRDRLLEDGVKVLVTQPDLREKISSVVYELPELQHIIVVNKNQRDPRLTDPTDLDYYEEMDKAPSGFDITQTCQNDYSVINYTSGAAGTPKGVVHRHLALVQQHATAEWVLDLHDDDIYWCTADPGWAMGTSYAILAPWARGVTQVVYEGGFRASAWYEVVQNHGITVWYTTPAAIRMLMNAGDALPKQYDLTSLRHLTCTGEQLEPDAVAWSDDNLAVPLQDAWWQTETGAILIASYPGVDVRPGSMGKPLPGVHAGIVDGDCNEIGPGEAGNLAIRPGWPSMFQAYWNDSALYNSRFRKGWYITGDRARRDRDGYYWSAGRADEAVNAARPPSGPL